MGGSGARKGAKAGPKIMSKSLYKDGEAAVAGGGAGGGGGHQVVELGDVEQVPAMDGGVGTNNTETTVHHVDTPTRGDAKERQCCEGHDAWVVASRTRRGHRGGSGASNPAGLWADVVSWCDGVCVCPIAEAERSATTPQGKD